jgi:hypothetical protein
MQSASTLQASPSGHPGHAPPQSTSVSLPFLLLSLQLGGGGTQALSLQISPGQSPSSRHSTQSLWAVHTPLLHALPGVAAVVPQAPASQVASWQSSGAGQSAGDWHSRQAPWPSQVPPLHGAPCMTKAAPQTAASQVARLHSGGAAQSSALVQPTHWPTASHTPALHGVPSGAGPAPQMPAKQVATAHSTGGGGGQSSAV